MPGGEINQAFIIHTRPYRDSSLLVDMFTAEQGMLRAVVRGARGTSKGGRLCQPFHLLRVTISGKGELKTAFNLEVADAPPVLAGRALFSAMYLNELLLRAMHQHEPHPEIFAAYQLALEALAREARAEGVLRQFELILLQDLGYGLDLASDANGDAIKAGIGYSFEPEQGLVPGQAGQVSGFRGEVLLQIAAGDYTSDAVRGQAKALFHKALLPLIGPQPLASRKLFGSGQA